MKTSFVVTLLLMIAIGVSSCSKKTDDITPSQTQTTTSTTTQAGFRVKVDGKEYAPDFAYALASFPGDNGYFAVYGLDSKTSDMIAIALPNTATEGTYQLSNVSFGIVTINKQDFSTINGGSGSITITKKTATNMTGTFSFTAFDASGTLKRTLTEGTFNVNFR